MLLQQRRQALLALAVAFGLAATAFAQSWDGSPIPGTFSPPASSDAEAKAAVVANRGDLQPASFPPVMPRGGAGATAIRSPGNAPMLNSQPPVWNVAPAGSRPPEVPNNGERSVHEFGTGWKNFVNQKVLGAPATPAAALSRPRVAPATPTARMDWNWQGYDTYNQRGDVVSGGVSPTAQAGMHPDMAPYMKYAHLWHASNNGFAQPVLSSAEQASSGPMPISLNRGPAATNWRSGPARSETAFAANDVDKNPVQPTSFATIASNNQDTLPERPTNLPKADPTPRPDAMINGVPSLIREQVATVCSGKARNVMVELIAPMRLRISFLVRQQADAELLTDQLARVRELAPYTVNFEVQIGQ